MFRWPLVWRSTMERRELAAENHGRAWVEETRRNEVGELRRQLSQAQTEDVTLRLQREAADKRELSATNETRMADQRRVQAEVRAQEWEAIARELISRGAGRPRPEGDAKPESALAKKIREESGGDAMLQAHYWKNVVAPARAKNMKDEDILGLIGWETHDPPADP